MLSRGFIVPAATFVLAAAAVAGCGGDGDGGPFTVLLEPDAVSVPAGGSAAVHATVERHGGFSEAVDLAFVGTVGGVSAVIAGQGDERTVTVAVQPDVAPGAYVAWVRGEAGTERAAAALSVEVTPGSAIDVRGRVIDVHRQPVIGASVHLGDGVVATGADGGFSFEGVTPPYDLAVVRSGAVPEVHAFEGLTRPNPELMLLPVIQDQAHHARVSGTLVGGGAWPNASAEVALVAFASDAGFGAFLMPEATGPAYGPLDVTWYGQETVTGTVHALRWTQDGNLFPDTYEGYGTREVTLADAQVATGQDVTLGAVTTTYLSLSIDPPSGYDVAGKVMWIGFGPWTSFPLAYDATTEPTATYATPLLDLPLGLQVNVGRSSGQSALYLANLAPNQVVTVAPEPGPVRVSPGSAATGVTIDTPFEWTAEPEAIHVAAFVAAAAPAFVVYTAGTTAHLPADVPGGPTLPPATTYAWTVSGVGPYASLDQYAAPDAGLPLFGLGADVALGVTTAATFTTQ